MSNSNLTEEQARGLCAVLYRCSPEFVLRVVPADPTASSVSVLKRGGEVASEPLFDPWQAQPTHAGTLALRERLVELMDAHGVPEVDRRFVLQPLATLNADIGEADLVQVQCLLLAAVRLVLHAHWFEVRVQARLARDVSRFACAAEAAPRGLLLLAARHALERECVRLDRLWLEQANAVQVQDLRSLVLDAFSAARRYLRRAA